MSSVRFPFAAALTAAALAPALPAGSADPVRRPLVPVPIQRVAIDDAFWAPRMTTWRTVTIPDCLDKFEKDGALRNFERIRDGASGGHAGPPWYDGLIYEMVRGAADFLAAAPDPALEGRIDGILERVAAAAARDPDGYLNTYTQLERPTQRFGMDGGDDNWQHDCYNAGAMVEAAVHWWRATGKTGLLAVATKLANHMCDIMGPPPRANVVPGHSIGEEALVKLWLLFREHPELKERMPVPVDEARYLRLAEFWIENRGNHEGRKSFGAYAQDHEPVLAQRTIEGHAVRATLLCAGVVAAGMANGREDYLAAARRLWENMVERRMYLVGGLGAIAGHEGFGADWALPNDGYLETCAAIGAGFFHHGMSLAFADARYVDELERGLYNGILSGVSLEGNSYFYENPQEAGRARRRWAWHGCPCCPPMLVKILGALPGYIYAVGDDGIRVNLWVGSRASIPVGGSEVKVRQTTRYPWDGRVRLAIDPAEPVDVTIHLRIPGWCRGASLALNGAPIPLPPLRDGYAPVRRSWKAGDVLELDLPMPVERVKAHPRVDANVDRVALRRGPIVYCLEGIDTGGWVRNVVLPPGGELAPEHRPGLLGGVTAIRGKALALERGDWGRTLYLPEDRVPGLRPIDLLAIPYYANCNRDPAEMQVWIAETPSRARAPTAASAARASASHANPGDALSALEDGIEPADSADERIPRFTWWDHRGTSEWVQYDFDRPTRLSAVEVYWWDERRVGRHCRVPASWRLLARQKDAWVPVEGAAAFGTEPDRFNRVEFAPVETTGLRIEAQLQPEWSGGILEWRIE